MRTAVLDIGGTAVKGGIWDGERLSEAGEWETRADRGADDLMRRAVCILEDFGSFDAIGISTAGQVDPNRGNIYYANDNIPGYTRMPVRDIMEERFGVPAAVENDVNCAALGELHFGAARGEHSFLCLTYGTGVGGAIITDGRLWTGDHYSAGSFGGIMTHPEKSRTGEEPGGCYEKYASTTALVRRVHKVDESLTDGRKVFSAAARPEIRKEIDEWIDEIVYGLVTLIYCFDPPLILLGGGVMSQDDVINEIRRKTGERLPKALSGCRMEKTALGNQAGMMGAAYLATERKKNENHQSERL
ncbi:MAG: ROK family protein [Lachnospiraceae bacterium]|nr:ROK family protein [Lachnospiraceae bacterium]